MNPKKSSERERLRGMKGVIPQMHKIKKSRTSEISVTLANAFTFMLEIINRTYFPHTCFSLGRLKNRFYFSSTAHDCKRRCVIQILKSFQHFRLLSGKWLNCRSTSLGFHLWCYQDNALTQAQALEASLGILLELFSFIHNYFNLLQQNLCLK